MISMSKNQEVTRMKEGYTPLPRWVPSSSFRVHDLIVFTFVGHVQVLHPFTSRLCFVFPPFC